MYKTLTLLALTLASGVSAIVTPTSPGAGDVYKSGGACPMAWSPDSTGKWTNMQIDLMTGDNLAQVKLATVVTGIDGTKQSTYTFACPEVTPNAPIYFYMFTPNGNTQQAQWTTRFTIASDSGATTAAPNLIESDGSKIPWGTGRLVGAIASNSTSSKSSVVSGSASSSLMAAVSASSSAISTVTPLAVASSSSSATLATTSSSSSTGSTPSTSARASSADKRNTSVSVALAALTASLAMAGTWTAFA